MGTPYLDLFEMMFTMTPPVIVLKWDGFHGRENPRPSPRSIDQTKAGFPPPPWHYWLRLSRQSLQRCWIDWSEAEKLDTEKNLAPKRTPRRW